MDYQAIVTEVLNELQPMISTHGGSIHFVSYENGIVRVTLEGMCKTCPISLFTLRYGILERLVEKIPDVQDVIAVE